MDLDKKLLSICIPTYNRANYLKQSLVQIQKELTSDLFSKIEVLVSDNCSTDNTSEVIDIFKSQGLDINYIRNNENLGWGMNFLQCFELANSKYVLLLGDDDVLYDNSINIIIKALQSIEIGVLTFKCFGYDNDWKSERPFSFSKECYFNDSIKYIYNIGPDITMISSCVINKDFIDIEKIKKYPIGNFAHIHLILTSALEAKNNLFISNYLVGAKRDNSSDYHFSLVFVKEIWNIFKMYKLSGLNHKVVKNLQNKWLFVYYPFYWLKQRLDSSNDYLDSLLHCDEVFKGNLLYYIWNRPILASPKYFAIFWGVITTFIGRSLNGELSKGFLFLLKKIR
jgi:abequosyltransferase